MPHPRRPHRFWTPALTAAVIAVAAHSGCELLEQTPLGDCEKLCAIEADCGLRDKDACLAAICPGGIHIPTASDACLLETDDCSEVAACACPEGCAKLDECTGAPDPSCADTCEGLVEQDPAGTYTENRCRIESSCDDLALCTSTEAPPDDDTSAEGESAE
jgi:hypothetical protein